MIRGEILSAKTITCVFNNIINQQNVMSKCELARKDSFSMDWMFFLSKEFLVSSSELGQLILVLGERSSLVSKYHTKKS